jgi:alpha-L-fucosidase 2
LPSAWPDGSVKGLLARGGFEVDLFWKEGALSQALIHSDRGGVCRIRHGDVTRDLELDAGKTFVWDGK